MLVTSLGCASAAPLVSPDAPTPVANARASSSSAPVEASSAQAPASDVVPSGRALVDERQREAAAAALIAPDPLPPAPASFGPIDPGWKLVLDVRGGLLAVGITYAVHGDGRVQVDETDGSGRQTRRTGRVDPALVRRLAALVEARFEPSAQPPARVVSDGVRRVATVSVGKRTKRLNAVEFGSDALHPLSDIEAACARLVEQAVFAP